MTGLADKTIGLLGGRCTAPSEYRCDSSNCHRKPQSKAVPREAQEAPEPPSGSRARFPRYRASDNAAEILAVHTPPTSEAPEAQQPGRPSRPRDLFLGRHAVKTVRQVYRRGARSGVPLAGGISHGLGRDSPIKRRAVQLFGVMVPSPAVRSQRLDDDRLLHVNGQRRHCSRGAN